MDYVQCQSRLVYVQPMQCLTKRPKTIATAATSWGSEVKTDALDRPNHEASAERRTTCEKPTAEVARDPPMLFWPAYFGCLESPGFAKSDRRSESGMTNLMCRSSSSCKLKISSTLQHICADVCIETFGADASIVK